MLSVSTLFFFNFLGVLYIPLLLPLLTQFYEPFVA